MIDLVEQYKVKHHLTKATYNTITLRQLATVSRDFLPHYEEVSKFPDMDDMSGEGIICAPRRSGKTIQLVCRSVYAMSTQRDCHIIFVIPQWTGYQRTIMEMLHNVISSSNLPEEQITYRDTMVCNRVTGSEIIVSNVNVMIPRRVSSDISAGQQLMVMVDEPYYIIRERFLEHLEPIILPDQQFRIAAYGTATNTTVNLGHCLEKCTTIPNLILRRSELV